MTSLFASQLRLILCCCALLISILLPASALADNWQLQVGAQNGDRSHQAIAFLPNEIWIHSCQRYPHRHFPDTSAGAPKPLHRMRRWCAAGR